MRLNDPPAGRIVPVDLGAIPARLALVAPGHVVEREHREPLVTLLAWPFRCLNHRIEQLVPVDLNLASDALIVGGQFGQAVEAPLQKRIEVNDVGRADVEKAGGITLAPAVERRSLQGDDVFDGRDGWTQKTQLTADLFNRNHRVP